MTRVRFDGEITADEAACADAAIDAGRVNPVNLYSGTKAAFAIGVEIGRNSRGEDESRTSSRCAHVHGQQRGWKLIENGNDLGRLARLAAPQRCTLVAGALGHVRGSRGPARNIAFCEM